MNIVPYFVFHSCNPWISCDIHRQKRRRFKERLQCICTHRVISSTIVLVFYAKRLSSPHSSPTRCSVDIQTIGVQSIGVELRGIYIKWNNWNLNYIALQFFSKTWYFTSCSIEQCPIDWYPFDQCRIVRCPIERVKLSNVQSNHPIGCHLIL